MATLLQPGVISVRIYKRKISNPALEWANTYELQQVEAMTNSLQYENIANGIVEAERQVHLASTEYTRAIISTWVPDGRPYNPLSFVTVPLNQLGQQDETGAQAEPLQVCLRVAFQADFGRQGFRLYRNALTEADVTAPGGIPVLGFGNVSTRFNAMATALQPYIGTSGDPYLVLASAGNTRTVTRLSLAGVTMKKFNNRYFDRVNTAP